MKFRGLPTESVPSKKPRRPSDLSTQPVGTWTTVEQLFARIPDIGDLFLEVSESPPGWARPIYDDRAHCDEDAPVEIDMAGEDVTLTADCRAPFASGC
jgi:hypothetical protein